MKILPRSRRTVSSHARQLMRSHRSVSSSRREPAYTGWELHHYAATHLGENNVPLQTVAKTRHRNPRTAMRYIRPNVDAVAEVTELLDLGRHHR
jgi:hypothetical protein